MNSVDCISLREKNSMILPNGSQFRCIELCLVFRYCDSLPERKIDFGSTKFFPTCNL